MKENKVFESIMKGLSESLEYAKGDSSKARRMNVIVSALPSYRDKEIKEIREKLRISPNTFVLGTVGRLVEQKNPLFALQIFKELQCFY